MKKIKRPKKYRCGKCQKLGHNTRTCGRRTARR